MFANSAVTLGRVTAQAGGGLTGVTSNEAGGVSVAGMGEGGTDTVAAGRCVAGGAGVLVGEGKAVEVGDVDVSRSRVVAVATGVGVVVSVHAANTAVVANKSMTLTRQSGLGNLHVKPVVFNLPPLSPRSGGGSS